MPWTVIRDGIAWNWLTGSHKGRRKDCESAAAGIQASYDEGKADEFVVPFVVTENGAPRAAIEDGDSVVFFNFRPDRAREITHAFCDDTFDGFEREKKLDLVYVCFTDYDETITNKLVAFKKEQITNTFGEFSGRSRQETGSHC